MLLADVAPGRPLVRRCNCRCSRFRLDDWAGAEDPDWKANHQLSWGQLTDVREIGKVRRASLWNGNILEAALWKYHNISTVFRPHFFFFDLFFRVLPASDASLLTRCSPFPLFMGQHSCHPFHIKAEYFRPRGAAVNTTHTRRRVRYRFLPPPLLLYAILCQE